MAKDVSRKEFARRVINTHIERCAYYGWKVKYSDLRTILGEYGFQDLVGELLLPYVGMGD